MKMAVETTGPPTRQRSPAVSVLVPLMDTRGEVADHLRSWTDGQTLGRERFQVVVASAATDPAEERRVEGLFAPHDVLVRDPGTSGVGLWNVAATRARAPWLLLTEAHCLGDADCLVRLVQALEDDPELEAATLEHGHVTKNATGELCERWFEQVYRSWASPGQWTRLNLVGVAIRKSVFEAVGGLEPRYGMFCAFFLSARLDERGVRVAHVPGARVFHVHNDTIRDHHGHTMNHARGECEARTDHDAAFCERYFGPEPVWGNRLRYRPEIARPAIRALASAGVRASLRRRRELPWLARELGAWLPAAVAGARPHALRQRLSFTARQSVAGRLPIARQWRWPSFLDAHRDAVRLARLEWVRDCVPAPDPPKRADGRWSVEQLDAALAGIHGLERHDGDWFRWTEPSVAMWLAPPSGDHVLTIETRGVRGAPLDYVTGVYADGRRLPSDRLLGGDDGRLSISLPSAFGERAASGGLTILARPFEPQAVGWPADARRLGIPIFSVELRPAP
jgi:hypothetical protein